jgi:hypothetical protein
MAAVQQLYELWAGDTAAELCPTVVVWRRDA